MRCEIPPGGWKTMELMREHAESLDDDSVLNVLNYYRQNKDRLTPYLMRWCSALRREARRRGLGT